MRLESRRWKLKADSKGSVPSSASCSLLEEECGRKASVQLPNCDLGTQSNPRYLNPHHGASVSQSHPKEHHGTPEGDSLLPILCLALTAGHGDLQPLTLQHQLDPKQKHPTFCPGSIPLRSQQQGQGLPVAQTLVLQKLLCGRKGKENLKDMDVPLLWGLWSHFSCHT